VPQRITYDNSGIAVIEVLKGKERKLTKEFLRLQSHYLFTEHFCRVRRVNEKGHVERLLWTARRRFLVPVPNVDLFKTLNRYLLKSYRRDLDERTHGRSGTKRDLVRDDSVTVCRHKRNLSSPGVSMTKRATRSHSCFPDERLLRPRPLRPSEGHRRGDS